MRLCIELISYFQNARSTLTFMMKTIRFIFTLLNILFVSFESNALVLEKLVCDNQLSSVLLQKKIGYYIGSFDPLHKGHEHIAESVVKESLCDYLLIYPSWGNDSYKTRADVNLRLDMLFARFEDHPKIIVTRYPPIKLQQVLTTKYSNNKPVVPIAEGMKFIGIIGSDTALMLATEKKSSQKFMAGNVISNCYQYHTWGGCIALPVDSFIVFLRQGDDLSSLGGKVAGRPIIKVCRDNPHDDLSSTSVKECLRAGKFINKTVSAATIKIIRENHLYN